MKKEIKLNTNTNVIIEIIKNKSDKRPMFLVPKNLFDTLHNKYEGSFYNNYFSINSTESFFLRNFGPHLKGLLEPKSYGCKLKINISINPVISGFLFLYITLFSLLSIALFYLLFKVNNKSIIIFLLSLFILIIITCCLVFLLLYNMYKNNKNKYIKDIENLLQNYLLDNNPINRI